MTRFWHHPPTLFLVALLAQAALGLALPATLPPVWRWSGGLLLVLGLAVGVAAERQFQRRGIAVRPGSKSTELVTDGWFRLSRNPMYLGFAVALAGIGLALGVPLALLPVTAFVAVLDRLVRREERSLRAQFGTEYEDYARRVRRWV